MSSQKLLSESEEKQEELTNDTTPVIVQQEQVVPKSSGTWTEQHRKYMLHELNHPGTRMQSLLQKWTSKVNNKWRKFILKTSDICPG